VIIYCAYKFWWGVDMELVPIILEPAWQAHHQFRLPHPQLWVKQQQLRLVTVTGAGEQIFRVRLSG